MSNQRVVEMSSVLRPGDESIYIMYFAEHGATSSHTHPFYEIVYIDSGFALHNCNGIIKILTAGDIFAMRPGDTHSYNIVHNTKLYNCLFYKDAIEWMEDELPTLSGVDRLFKDSNIPWKKINLDMTERREAVLLLEKMRWESLNKGVGWKINMKGLLANFIVFYSRVYSREFEDSSESDSIYSKYIMKLLEYIENNYSKEIDTEDISNAIGLSPDYVAKQFKLVLGISPIEYLRNYRIAKAMELLKNTNSSIDEISHKLGFASVSLFSRQFKSILKVTPTEFRKG